MVQSNSGPLSWHGLLCMVVLCISLSFFEGKSAVAQGPGCNPKFMNLELLYIQERTYFYCRPNSDTNPGAGCEKGDEWMAAKSVAIEEKALETIGKVGATYGSFKLAYAEFSDKPVEPFGHKYDKCQDQVTDLADFSVAESKINEHRAFWWNGWQPSGRDLIENQLDGIIESVSQTNFTGGREGVGQLINLQVAFVVTDKLFHVAGDATAAFAEYPEVCPQNGVCPDYVVGRQGGNCAGFEYPTEDQVITKLREKDVNAFFFLGYDTPEVRKQYNDFNKKLESLDYPITGILDVPSEQAKLEDPDPKFTDSPHRLFTEEAFGRGLLELCNKYVKKRLMLEEQNAST